MDGEDKKGGTKKRSKKVEITMDSDDDEPIGSLLKLKSKRNSKKVKLANDGEKGKKVEIKVGKIAVANEDLGGMEDTLASFRKKLKGPKKDSGSGSLVKKEAALKVDEPWDECVNMSLKDEGFVVESVGDANDKIGPVTSDLSISQKSEKKREREVKRSKSLEVLLNTDDVRVSNVGASVDQMQMLEGLQKPQNKRKKKDRRSKSSLAGNTLRSSIETDDGDVPETCDLGDQIEWKISLSSPSHETLGDSLSSFLKKALKSQSGSQKKLRASSSSKPRKRVQVLENDSCPSSDGRSLDFQFVPGTKSLSGAKPCTIGQTPENHLSNCNQISSGASQSKLGGDQINPAFDDGSGSMLIGDSMDINAMITEESMRYGDNRCGDTSESVTVSIVPECCSLVPCSQKIEEPKNSNVFAEAEVTQEEPLVDSIDVSCKKDTSGSPGVQSIEQCSFGSQNGKLQNGVSDLVNLNASSRSDVPCSALVSESTKELSKPNNLESNVICGDGPIQKTSRIDPSCADQDREGDAYVATDVSERANEMSPPAVPDEADACQEDGRCLPDVNNKCDGLVASERAIRKAKKRKDSDMAYEGDYAWEVLVHEHGAVERDQGNRPKERLYSSPNADPDLEAGGVAAVSVGLKAHAVGPVEKFKFKEVLKRKSGLQEYLECRNKILCLWNKDVTRILPLTDCGVSAIHTDNEPSRASLMRDVYSFLDQSGYINSGIAANKEKAEPSSRGTYKLLGEKKFEGSSGASVADSADGVSFILGQIKSADTSSIVKDEFLDDESHLKAVVKSSADRENDPSPDKLLDGSPDVEELDKQLADVKISEPVVEPAFSTADLPEKSLGNVPDPCKSVSYGQTEATDLMECDLKNQQRIIVVGAGPAGLTAARHLQRQGFSVTVLEARSRIGGRVYTDRSSLSVPVDLGASIITGVEADVASERRPDPSSLICAQLGLELTILNSDCPLYDIITGQKVPADVDEALEAEFNSLLDDMVLVVSQKGEYASRMSLEDGLEYGLKRRHKFLSGINTKKSEVVKPLDATVNRVNGTDGCDLAERNDGKDDTLNPLERRVMDWHFAHLEYGCAAVLKDVSLPHWNQDDVYGGFGGAHCMIKGGYSAVVESIAQGISYHLNQVVENISYCGVESESNDNCSHKVKVSTSNGNEFFGDAVLITVPLGCLKAESIKFSPPLPQWKHSAIQRLGFGVLNKVVLEFPEVFWDDSVDYFGATAEQSDLRGRCFMFWNVKKTVGAPVLIALVVGKAAIDGQDVGPSDHVCHALAVLRKLFGDAAVPDPVASVVTDWGRDPFSYGAYSYVAVGASGADYDILGRPVENCLFFAGEATCKEHPDTVGGAMMSGLREAVRIVDILTTGNDYTAEAEAIETAQKQSKSERSEVKDIARRLESALYNSLSKERLLQEMFFNAKTFAGRLRLAKELLNLPVESLKSFAGTKEGLSVLNSWILDSMGKDGTQLLRHCVRLLVLVSTDLVAVRLSGIGKTVKEKVCVHTSRDIRGIASQLVNMWIEVFRKEKSTNGGLKLLRHTANADSSKARGKDSGFRKPPVGVQQSAFGNKAALSTKKPSGKPVKLETEISTKAESMVEEVKEDIPLSEEAQAALAAAEAARAAAAAAAEAYASSEARCSMMQLPKIPSFQKFARREQYAQMDETERKLWSGGVLGRQDCISEIDSRNCRVRDWSVDFSATCPNLDSSRMSADNLSQRSHSNDMAQQLNWRENSGESAAGDSTAFTKAWVDSSGSVGIKDYHAIERWQCQAAEAEYEYQSSMHVRDEEDSSAVSRSLTQKHEGPVNESSVSQVTINKDLTDQRRGAEHIKQGVVDYVASLLMPLYKARKIDKDGYKSIMKKSATKVMEQTTDAEKTMTVCEFLDFKRKNKIRAFVDKLIERHMSMKPIVKP